MKRFPHPYPFLALFCLGSLSLGAEEIHSNGLGGGKWSSTETWEERKLPVAEDVVVIASGDTVVFDRDDSAGISCAALLLDPESQFVFDTSSHGCPVISPTASAGC